MNIEKLRILDESILNEYKKIPHRRPRIAVVGNAGVSDEDNAMIQDADCVIRFNNYATRADIQYTDDRNKCDILFSTFDLHSTSANPKHVVIGIPYPFKAVDIIRKTGKWYDKAQAWMINPYMNMMMSLSVHWGTTGHAHPLPSLGFTALWHMRNWKADFYICGFSWYYDPKTHNFQNWNLKNRQYPSNWNHNYPIEIEWIIDNLLRKSNYTFSPSCNKIINVARHILGK